MSSQQEVIKKFMASLDKTTLSGTAALDEAIKNCSNFNGIQDAINNLVSDCSLASSANDFLVDKCGIILDNDDTGAITGSDAGGSKVKNAEDIVNETRTFDRNFNRNSFTIKNYNITFQLEKEFDTLTDKQKHIWQGLYTFWVEESLKLIKESYGYSFADADATVNKITLEFHTSETLSVMGQVTGRSKNGKATEISMLINVERVDNLSEDDVSGKLWRGYYFDRMIAHELTHAIMRAKIDNYSKLPRFFREGIAELTHGIDDKRRNLIQSLSNDPENLKKYLNLDSEDLGSNSEGYAAGYMLLRYLAKQAANDIDSKVIYGTSGADNISNTVASATIYGYAGDDTINNNWVKATNVKIFGGAGKDLIYNSGSGATIDGGANDDTIDSGYIQSSLTSIFAGDGDDVIEIAGTKSTVNGGSGLDIIKAYRQASLSSIFGDAGNDGIINYASKVTINGGAGNDYISLAGSSQLITYSNGDGNDTVYGYKSSDTISIGGGSSYSTTKSGSDMKINFGNGSILVKNAANSTVNIYPPSTISPDPIENYTKNKTVNGTTSNDTIENYAGGVKIFGYDGNDSIYNSTRGQYTIKSSY
ncbi:MAG: calcium-binding protein, partial [Selenomonadaceae bacterium]|nr:calcium-binding protein [Selenomonadaceae bacterium]